MDVDNLPHEDADENTETLSMDPSTTLGAIVAGVLVLLMLLRKSLGPDAV